MIKTPFLLVGFLLFAVSGCVYETGPGYPTRPGHSTGNNAYQNGYERGRQDARSNRSRSPERWLSGNRGGNRPQFIRGYNDGYDQNRPSQGDARRFYQNGLSLGESDARRGLSRSSTRHHKSVPTRYRNDFNRGYHEGYDGYRPSGGGIVNPQRFERRGRDAAQTDQRRNLSYNPSRHFNEVPRSQRGNFERGYAAGWRGPRR